jgi:PAT family beta-lactamase induction signal transducer AmpG
VGLADPLLSVAAMPLHRGLAVHYLHGAGQRYLNGWLLEITTAPIIGLGCGLLLTGLVLALRYFKPDEQLQAGAVGPV